MKGGDKVIIDSGFDYKIGEVIGEVLNTDEVEVKITSGIAKAKITVDKSSIKEYSEENEEDAKSKYE